MIGPLMEGMAGIHQQHFDSAVALSGARERVAAHPTTALRHLRIFDDRLAAHLDGLKEARLRGRDLQKLDVGNQDGEGTFTALVLALENRDPLRIEQLLAVAEAVPAARAGLLSGLAWVSPPLLLGTIMDWLGSASSFRRGIAIAACATHRADAGPALMAALEGNDGGLCVRALQAAGELGRQDLAVHCARFLEEQDETLRFWSAWSSVLLGSRVRAVEVLLEIAGEPGPLRRPALELLLMTVELPRAHEVLRSLSSQTANLRYLIQAVGVVGDPHYVPWLIGQMASPEVARVAGASFCLITGCNLSLEDLDTRPPADAGGGPTDDPAEESVSMHEDEGLPWPDAGKIGFWWNHHSQRFEPGRAYFLGWPMSESALVKGLNEGFQPQRRIAALRLCLGRSGSPLFNTQAPAWRQQAQLTGFR